jgi:AcrR family transcriptional regulator
MSRLDLETIVSAGLAIASRPGTQAVTVRELGAQLGADPTAIYRHVRNKDGLVQVLLDRIIGIAAGRVEAAPSDWRAFLRQSADQTLAVYVEYPAIGAEAVRLSSDGDNELLVVDRVLAAFGHAGLAGAERVRFYAMWSVLVISSCAGFARERMASGGGTEPAVWLGRALEVEPGRFPQVAQNREALRTVTDIGAFRDALELLLDAAAERATRPQ